MVFEPIPEDTHIGHVHLKVADLHRSLEFYHGVLGFTITQQIEDSAAFLSAGDYHHHIGINTGKAPGAHHHQPVPLGSTIWQSVTIRELNSQMPCDVYTKHTSSWTELQTTE